MPEDADPMYDVAPGMVADGLADREEHHMSMRAAGELPSGPAGVRRCAFFGQKSHRVIAREQKLPLGTVKSRHRPALKQLPRTLEPAP